MILCRGVEMDIKVFKSQLISSNMYILTSNKNAIIIDPCISYEGLKYIEDNSLNLDYIILTHEHYDHISGVNWLKENFGCKVICNENCAKAIQKPNHNLSKYFNVLIDVLPKEEMSTNIKVEPYYCYADITFGNQKYIEWEGHNIELISTPGHSKGSICVKLDDKYLFSGDSLLKDYPVITRLPGGSSKTYNTETLEFLKSLSQEIIVHPGHYESFKLKDAISNTSKID